MVLKEDKAQVFLNNDNDEGREVVDFCIKQRKTIVNPIIDWDDSEVWEFIKENNLRYCSLYDEGFKRLGCIGCPNGNTRGMLKDFERWPKYKKLYINAFQKMIETGPTKYRWKTGEDVFRWWIGEEGDKE